MKPTMSMALNKEHLDQLLLEYYKARSELLGELLNQKMGIKNFRSGGFVNKDCDMTLISFEMPITSAKIMLGKF